MARRSCSNVVMKRDVDTLRAVGEALFGPSWQTPLAEALGISDRNMRYWLAGRDIPEGVWSDIAKICKARSAELAKWEKRLQP